MRAPIGIMIAKRVVLSMEKFPINPRPYEYATTLLRALTVLHHMSLQLMVYQLIKQEDVDSVLGCLLLFRFMQSSN